MKFFKVWNQSKGTLVPAGSIKAPDAMAALKLVKQRNQADDPAVQEELDGRLVWPKQMKEI